jgi:hypothetical protein
VIETVCEFMVLMGHSCCATTDVAEMAFINSVMNLALRPRAASTAGLTSGIRLRLMPNAVGRALRTRLVFPFGSASTIMDWIASKTWRQAVDVASSHDAKNWAMAICHEVGKVMDL